MVHPFVEMLIAVMMFTNAFDDFKKFYNNMFKSATDKDQFLSMILETFGAFDPQSFMQQLLNHQN